MPTEKELEGIASAEIREGSPLHTMIVEYRKPKPDTVEFWQEVAQGLGVKIHDLRAEIERLKTEKQAFVDGCDAVRHGSPNAFYAYVDAFCKSAR